ncbi:MAG: class I SAM-dependent methyltransferase, partial [Chloroflexota bacterium]
RVDALDLSEAMMAQCRAKIGKFKLGTRVHFKQANARELPFSDETFDVVYNGYMFDLIPLDGSLPILNEMARVLKPGGKLALVNMSKRNTRRTFFDTMYEKGLPVGPCRPVLMHPYLELAGFVDSERIYRPNHVGFIPLPFGTEIVLARKPARAPKDRQT